MYNPKCCGQKMAKQEIHYGQNWLCLTCGREHKTPANGMTKKDISGYCKNKRDFARQYLSEIGRKGGRSGTGDAKRRPIDYKALSAAGVAARKKKDKQK